MEDNKTMDTTPNFDTDSSAKEVVSLYLDDIIPNRFQPRERFDENALKELAASIKAHGVIQPIIVRRIGEKYEIIAGERRYKASAMAGLTKIPAIIRNLDDKESSKVALLENLQRKNLSAIEEARTYQKILDLDEMTQFELAKTMGKSQPAVANKLRLLTLPDEVQDALLKEKISERHARSLLNLTNEHDQIEMLHKIIDNKMTVRDLDREIKTKTRPLQGLEQENGYISKKKNVASFEKTNGLNFDSRTESSSMEESFDKDPTPITESSDEQPTPIMEKTDIEINSEKTNGNSIDSLLNLNTIDNKENTSEQENELNDEPIEEYPEIKLEVPSDDTLKETDLSNIEFPKIEETEVLTKEDATNDPEILSEEVSKDELQEIEKLDITNDEMTKEDAIKEIEQKIDEIKEKGISIDKEAMDFGDTYQIIIRINKNE